MRRAALFTIAAFAALTCGAGLALAVSTDQLVHVNRTTANAGGDRDASITTKAVAGDLVVFTSSATNLPPNNGFTQAYVRDTSTGVTTLVSKTPGPAGSAANNHVSQAAISGNGQYVVFATAASNLAAGDVNGVHDVFRVRLSDGALDLISIDDADGNANAQSVDPSISSNGSRVAFLSDASDLIAGDAASTDAFVRDTTAGETTRMSVSSAGSHIAAHTEEESVEISPDGSMVAFTSSAPDLAPGDSEAPFTAELYARSVDGSIPTHLVSVRSNGIEAVDGESFRASLSQDGRYVAFESDAADMVGGVSGVHTYVRDRVAGTTVLAGRADGASGAVPSTGTSHPSISDDGRFVAFYTKDTAINPGGSATSHVHVRDTLNNTTSPASRLGGATGAQADGNSTRPAMAPAGNAVAFESVADNLAAATSADGDVANVFLRGYAPPAPPQGPTTPLPNPPADVDPIPQITSMKFSPAKFHPAKTKRAKRGGTKIRIIVSEPVTVTGVITPQRKGSRPLGSITFKAKAGATNYRFNGYVKGKRLKPGKYTATFTYKSATGQGGEPSECIIKFVVKK